MYENIIFLFVECLVYSNRINVDVYSMKINEDLKEFSDEVIIMDSESFVAHRLDEDSFSDHRCRPVYSYGARHANFNFSQDIN